MSNMLMQFVRDEEGAVAIEYALLAALIALAIIAGAGALGTELSSFFQSIATFLQGKEP
jgi:pilus assembly protein Flp/PilA